MKQWERERIQTKPRVKDASKTDRTDTCRAGGSATEGPVPTTSQPQVTAQSTQQPALSSFPTPNQHHQFVTFPPFPAPPQNFPPHPQFNTGYMAPMFAQNATPFGPSPGFPTFAAHPQNPYQYYPTPGPYWPASDDRFSESMPNHPVPSGSHPYHPIHHTNFAEPHHGRNSTNRRPGVSTHQPSPQPFRGYAEPDPAYEDPTRFPLLQEWLADIDNDSTRATYGDVYSQYSSAFETRGLRSLLDLEAVNPDHLFEQFGIPEASARRLLRLALQDIWSIRDIRN